MVKIREAKQEDYNKGIKYLLQEISKFHSDLRPNFFIDEFIDSKSYFEECLNNKDYYMYIAEKSKKVVGYVEFFVRTYPQRIKKTVFVTCIVVADYLKNQGIGKKLFREVEKISKKLNLAIELNVWAFNKNAIEFYEGLGFKIQRYTLERE